MEPEHMVKIMAVVFSSEIVVALVFRINELGRSQEKSVGVNDQIAVGDSRYDETRVQFDELLQIPGVSLIFAVIYRDLANKWENGFVNDDGIWNKKIKNRSDNINIPQPDDVGFCAGNLFLYVFQIVGT
jgi:hypothetical protein